jgi:hypothetical protein
MFTDFPACTFDVEIYPNFSLIGVLNIATGAARQFSNVYGIGDTFADARLWFDVNRAETLHIGFNSVGYDNTMVKTILDGQEDPQALYELSQRTIATKRHRQEAIGGEVGIDLYALHGGQNARIGSLKECAIKLDCYKIQELPYPFDAVLTFEQMKVVAQYNLLDLEVTRLVANESQDMIMARLALSVEYGLPLFNMHDAKCAEKVLATKLFCGGKPDYPTATSWAISGKRLTQGFDYAAPELRELLDRISQWSMNYKLVSTTDKDGETEKSIEGATFADSVKLGEVSYRIGVGGLHSVDEPAVYEADDQYRLIDFDVASFYPALILNHRLAPSHLNRTQFLRVFRGLRDRRLAAKDAGQDTLALGLKIAVNSVFGKTKSPYSWLLDPTMNVAVTVIGQLTLFRFVDLVHGVAGIDVVSANTDGVTLRVQQSIAEDVIAMMHATAGQMDLELSLTEYASIARRDINNFVAVKLDGSVKAKGSYAYDRHALGKKAVNRVVVDAAQKFFVDGTPVADTIRACTDIRSFVDYFKATKGYAIVDHLGAKYGGIARWYLGVGGVHLDKVKTEDSAATQLVERGAVVVNDLPEAFPLDVDYAAYETMADKLVLAITEPETKVSHTIPLAELSKDQREKRQRNQDTTTADPATCRAIALGRLHSDYAAVVKGNRYNTMKTLLVRLWLAERGAITAGDLMWFASELDAADGYFAGTRKSTLVKMVEWIAREISPFPKPQTSEEIVAAGLVWATENVEPLKRKRKMEHRSVLASTYLPGDALRKYAKSGGEYALACAIAASGVRHGVAPGPDLMMTIINDVKTYFSNKEIETNETV